MKPVKHIVLFILSLLLFFSCSRRHEAVIIPELAEADSLMYVSPDSALQLLQQMPPPSSSHPLQHATWALLLTQARYRCYVEQDDSLLNIAASYFMKGDDARRRALVLYLKACLLDKAWQMSEQQACLMEADREVEKTEDVRLGYLINSNIARICAFASLPDDALKAAAKALSYARRSGDRRYVVETYIQYGRIYAERAQREKDRQQTESYRLSKVSYRKAFDITGGQVGYSPLAAQAANELAMVYNHSHQYDSAFYWFRRMDEINRQAGVPNTPQSCLMLGDVYRHLHQADSAFHYLHKALETDNLFTLQAAYLALYYLSKDKNRYRDAAYYSGQYELYSDSIRKNKQQREMVELREKYGRLKIEEEKNSYALKNSRIVRRNLILTLVLITVIALLAVAYQRELLRKERVIRSAQEEIRLAGLRIQDNERVIAQNRVRMDELSELIEADRTAREQQSEEQATVLAHLQEQNRQLTAENKQLQQKIHGYDSRSGRLPDWDYTRQLSQSNARLRKHIGDLQECLLQESETLRQLITSHQYLKPAQWEKVRQVVDKAFGGYTQRLQTDFPQLTNSDLEVCILIKLRVRNQGIADILGISPAAVSKRKYRLKENLLQTIGSFGEGQTLETWLREY